MPPKVSKENNEVYEVIRFIYENTSNAPVSKISEFLKTKGYDIPHHTSISQMKRKEGWERVTKSITSRSLTINIDKAKKIDNKSLISKYKLLSEYLNYNIKDTSLNVERVEDILTEKKKIVIAHREGWKQLRESAQHIAEKITTEHYAAKLDENGKLIIDDKLLILNVQSEILAKVTASWAQISKHEFALHGIEPAHINDDQNGENIKEIARWATMADEGRAKLRKQKELMLARARTLDENGDIDVDYDVLNGIAKDEDFIDVVEDEED